MTHNLKLKYLAGITLAAAALCSCESLDYTPGDRMSGQNFGRPKTMPGRQPSECMPQ